MSFHSNVYDNERAPIPRDYRSQVYYSFFGKANISYISNEITNRLTGVHPQGKNIIVPTETILSVMDSMYENTYRDVDKLTMMTISYIVEYISNEYEIEMQNSKLNAWVMTYPPEYGMQQVPQIKLREKRPAPMIFNMNY